MLEEIRADAPSVSMWISKIFRIYDGRKMAAVEIFNALCCVWNIDILKDSTFLYKNLSSPHDFSNFSQVCMFCDDNRLKLVAESTCSEVS